MQPTKLFHLLNQEQERQEQNLSLIASENYASAAVLNASGSVLTNKYAEGYPDKRYYGGCEVVDVVEEYARHLGRNLFQTEHINVQPHSGSSANMAAYLSILKPGDTVLGMDLKSGGHLTHGHKINFSGKLYNFIGYGLSPETEQLDYTLIAQLADQHKPKLIIAGASAYARTIDFKRIADIAQTNQSYFMVDMAHIAGLIAAGAHPSPMAHADIVTSTTHKTLRGPRGGFICTKKDLGAALDKAVFPGVQGGPLMHIIAAKAVAFYEASQVSFKVYQEQIIKNAQTMCSAFQQLGYRVVSGGTDNHLFLLDLRSKKFGSQTLSGATAETTLTQCNIILNRNLIPFDPAPPLETSGIRIGTPAITTRGLQEKESLQIVQWIDEALTYHQDTQKLSNIRKEVEKMCAQFPIYKESVIYGSRPTKLLDFCAQTIQTSQ